MLLMQGLISSSRQQQSKTLFLMTQDLFGPFSPLQLQQDLRAPRTCLDLIKVRLTSFRLPAPGRLSNTVARGRLANTIVKHLVSGLIRGKRQQTEVGSDRICFELSLKHIQEHRVQHQQGQGSCSLWPVPVSLWPVPVS